MANFNPALYQYVYFLVIRGRKNSKYYKIDKTKLITINIYNINIII